MGDEDEPRAQPLLSQAVTLVSDTLNGRNALAKFIPPALLALDAVLCGVIIWRVPYTEIDWQAYMQQVSQFLSGERDYSRLEGGTGPLVYPAAHVYIYSGLYYLTDEGRDIFLAQQLFAILYLATLALVMGCYWQAKVPPYVFPLLVLSKRLHSIFVLRCFNDCFAAFFLWLTIFLLQRRSWTLASLAYTLGLGVKMTLLLVLPALALVLFLGRGLGGSLRLAWLMAQVQLALAVPFLAAGWRAYLGRAFQLGRRFLFRWTVNWRFVGEDVFLNPSFSIVLLAGHLAVLVAILAIRWWAPARKPLPDSIESLLRGRSPFSPHEERMLSLAVTPRYVMTTVLGANVIGLLFARSLHYQFYAYLAWATPYLLWRSGMSPVFQYVIWGVQEAAWNVFPSTSISSGFVVEILALTVLTLFKPRKGEGEETAPEKDD